MEHQYPFGPLAGPLIVDEFTYEQVNEKKCKASICQNICSALVDSTSAQTKYLPVCMPCYNEDLPDLLMTMNSLLENAEFMLRKARMHDDRLGTALKEEYKNTIPVIVPIFDGTKALSSSVRSWLQGNFPGLLDDLDGASPRVANPVDVRIASSKWWYFCNDVLPTGETTDLADLEANTKPIVDKNMMMFHVIPIVKRSNHRKHNSHEWFFNSICKGLGNKCHMVFLTDCGTTFKLDCLALLYHELFFRNDLIGVTARQRVAMVNEFYHLCDKSCWKGSHTGWKSKACLGCYLNFFLSPCPLQGFEFEATLITNSSMFNLVEALPVMPGPCQLLNWKKMRNYKVMDEYFNFLFHGEADETVPTLPSNFRKMKIETSTCQVASSVDSGYVEMTNVIDNTTTAGSFASTVSRAIATDAAATGASLSTTEFIRANMRLAEDRILSFVAVFGTGFGTKWIPGATFYYQAERFWQDLLTQRRRWMNGTFASFLFFFKSKRARTRILSGMHDSHKAGKNMRLVSALWGVQLFQLLLVLITPAIFGSAFYIALTDNARLSPAIFGWANNEILGTLTIADISIGLFFLAYSAWTLYSHYAPKGKIPEVVCQCLAMAGFVMIFPVYFAIVRDITVNGFNFVSALVMINMILPVFIALAQSTTSAVLYLCYLPYFLIYIIMFLVFIPAYSFSRLWDSTWGNREGAADSAISNAVEAIMKRRNLKFVYGVIILNILLCWALIRVLDLGYSVVVGFMILVFLPTVVQLLSSFVFLYVVMPFRSIMARDTVGRVEKPAALATSDDVCTHSTGSSSLSFSGCEDVGSRGSGTHENGDVINPLVKEVE